MNSNTPIRITNAGIKLWEQDGGEMMEAFLSDIACKKKNCCEKYKRKGKHCKKCPKI